MAVIVGKAQGLLFSVSALGGLPKVFRAIRVHMEAVDCSEYFIARLFGVLGPWNTGTRNNRVPEKRGVGWLGARSVRYRVRSRNGCGGTDTAQLPG